MSVFTPLVRGLKSDTSADRALGVVLAGGRGSRLGGGKAGIELAQRPLISYPLAAIEAAGLEAVVVTKPAEGPPPSCGSFVRVSRTKEPQ
ncbi:MAG TPA: NTP transferase domain-containing protein, partial [Solirubrobacterales bacterium]|nr:NTP transferase domain-containing protein [Solirubrobacterales bacterium]